MHPQETGPVRLIDCDQTHASDILAILNEAIITSTALWDYEPRPAEAMTTWFEAKQAGNYPVIGIIDDQSRLLGFATYGTFRPWPAYKYSIENSVYVDKNHRGQGIGKLLLREIIQRAREQQYHNIIAGIEATNEASKALHKSLGFEPCGIVRHAGYKFGKWLDLELFQLLLDMPEPPTEE